MLWLTVLGWLRKPWVLLSTVCVLLLGYNAYLRNTIDGYKETARVEKALRDSERKAQAQVLRNAETEYDRELAILRAASYPSGPLRLYVSAPLRAPDFAGGTGPASPPDVPVPVREGDRVSRDVGPSLRALMDEADELALKYNRLLHSCQPRTQDR